MYLIDRIFGLNLFEDNVPFERYILLRASLIGSFFCFVGGVSNILIGLPDVVIWATLGGFFLYLSFYIMILRDVFSEFLFRFIPTFSVVYLNVLWFFNFMSNGPILYLLIVCYFFLLLLPRRINNNMFILLALLNMVVLFYIDYRLPLSSSSYHNQTDKLVDIYISAFFSLFLLLSIASIIKKYYVRELTRALESDNLKSAFLANLSHEIRTPLNAIIGFSSLLAEEDFVPAEKVDFYKLIRDNGNQLCNLMDKLIVVSKIESNNLKLKKTECDLSLLFNELYNNYLPDFKNKNLDFDYVIRGKYIVFSDYNMVKLVLSELLSNSLKFSKRGKVRFGVVTCKERCLFFVKDQGIGIREENKQKIFSHFIKISEYSRILVSGTGLGLTIVKHIVRQLGSEIKFKSIYKRGSVFYFSMSATNEVNNSQ